MWQNWVRSDVWSSDKMRNFHLLDWAISEIRQSKARNAPDEVETKLSVANEVESDLHRPREDGEVNLADTPWPDEEVVAAPDHKCFVEPNAAAMISTEADRQPKLGLRKAIVERDPNTSPDDRDRAITLRWTLRDINSKRLALSPVGQDDLQDLIDMGLVEMRDNAPVLTSAGVGAVS
jgi:hypothetical protein